MRDPDRDDLVMSFEDRLREWSRRSPNLPTSIARTRVLARLPEVSRPVPWRRLAAAAALVVVLVVVLPVHPVIIPMEVVVVVQELI